VELSFLKSASKRPLFIGIKTAGYSHKKSKKDANLSSKCAKKAAKQSFKYKKISLGALPDVEVVCSVYRARILKHFEITDGLKV
jgi:hypothetical protein